MTRSDAIAQYFRALTFGQISPPPTTLEAFLALDTAGQNALLLPWLEVKETQAQATSDACLAEKTAITALIAIL